MGPGTGRLFGASVAVGRRVVVVGAPLGADGGTAHVYRPAWTGDLFPWLRREAGQPLPSWSMYGAGVAADDWLFAVGEPRVASHGEGGVHVEAYGLGPADRTPGGG